MPRDSRPESPAAAIILAAGKSTRMRSSTPKAAHTLCGRAMVSHVIEACRQAGVGRIVVVVGHEAEQVMAAAGSGVEYAVQADQLGTGHAARCAEGLLSDHQGPVLVLAGDVPLLQPQTLTALLEAAGHEGVGASMLIAEMDEPTGYGRVVRLEDGSVEKIVEHKDATPEIRAIREWNPSVYCFAPGTLFRTLKGVQANNVQREYYLTDTVGLLVSAGTRVVGVPVGGSPDVLGVNTHEELAVCAQEMRRRILGHHMVAGVAIVDPTSTYIDADVTIGVETRLEPGTILAGRTTVGSGCRIGPYARITDTTIGNDCRVEFSQVVGAAIGDKVTVGPFAHLRLGTVLRDGVRVGNYVEVKNSTLGAGTKASHLTYLGDATVGETTNIGAGVVFCNYDGYEKHRTDIGDGVFIGSNVTLVAPVTVGDGALIAAGSTITRSVEADSLAIARPDQSARAGWARRYREAKLARMREAGK